MPIRASSGTSKDFCDHILKRYLRWPFKQLETSHSLLHMPIDLRRLLLEVTPLKTHTTHEYQTVGASLHRVLIKH